MTVRYPVIPVDNIVIMPNTVVPLHIPATFSLEFIETLKASKKLLVVLQRPDFGSADHVSFESIFEVGTLCELIQCQEGPQFIKILVEGQRRVKVHSLSEQGDLLLAEHVLLREMPGKPDMVRRLIEDIQGLFRRYSELEADTPSETILTMLDPTHPAQFGDLIASYVSVDVYTKQRILEEPDVQKRLNLVKKVLLDRLEALALEHSIDDSIQSRLEEKMLKDRRDSLLRAKLSVIQDELQVNTLRAEIQAYEERLAVLHLPEEDQALLLKEIRKLERTPVDSSESASIRGYLDFVFKLPWGNPPSSDLNIKKVEAELTQNHYGLLSVKSRILEYLAVLKLTGKGTSTILCLEGPPGVGKTSIVHSVAQALGRKFVRIALGGVRDEADLRGHRRTYVGALPGKIIYSLFKVQANNPVILLDEIDKMTSGYQGDPAAALLEILDPVQNSAFVDHYLQIPFDLSHALFICTANTRASLPPALQDRLEVISIPGYTIEEKRTIVKQHIMPKQLAAHGLHSSVQFSPDALEYLILQYTSDPGLRPLERQIEEIMRKLAFKVLDRQKIPSKLTPNVVRSLLGTEKKIRQISRVAQPGCALALQTDATVPQLYQIEVAFFPGNGHVYATGNIHATIHERVSVCLSYLKQHLAEFKLAPDVLRHKDVHVHFTHQRIHKQGEGWGLAIFAAMVSALKQVALDPTAVFMGEITLLGNVLAVPNLFERLLTARQFGIKTAVLPRANLDDADLKIPSQLDIYPVGSLRELIPLLQR